MKKIRFAIVLAALALVAYTPHNSSAPTRWALIVGISDYENFGAEVGGDLPGAAWDARRMRDVLVARWGFDAERVRLVLDTDATRARIESELTDWLPSVVKEDDLVVFFFAGHGSQAWDLVGDEEDGLDETICPTDVLKGDASRDIRDDELDEWLTALPAEVVVVLDNCHAGTGTRAVTPFARPRSLARDVEADVPQPEAAAGATAASVGRTAAVAAPRNVLEIAAAQADEVAVDAEWPGTGGAPPTYGGAFTTALVRELWRAPRRTSYSALYQLTAEAMKRERFAQQPLLTMNGVETKPFAAVDGEPETAGDAFVPVTGVSGSEVRLGGGAGAGITVGSLFTAGDALLRVTDVAGDAATAVVESGPAPGAATPARLVAFAYPDAILRVSLADVDDATRSAVMQATGSRSTLQFTTSPREFAHLIIRPAERGYVVLGMDGATRHHVTGARDAATRTLAGLLQGEAGAHQLAALDNPGQASALDFGFRDGRSSFRVGEEIGFRVRAPRAGYLTIVDLGTDGRVVVLYPNEPGQDNRIAAGATFELPDGDLAFEAQAPAGRGIVRAFLTERPMDLRFTGDAPEQAGTVLQAVRRGAGDSPVSGSMAIPTATWLTSSIVYTIEPR